MRPARDLGWFIHTGLLGGVAIDGNAPLPAVA
jgi:hypothetical protein